MSYWMANPSISLPDDMLEEIDDRRHSTTDRSEWIRQAIIARMNAEDSGKWETPEDWAGVEEWKNDQKDPSAVKEVSAESGR